MFPAMSDGENLRDKQMINDNVSQQQNVIVGESIFLRKFMSASSMFRRELLLLASRRQMLSPQPLLFPTPRWTPAATPPKELGEKQLKHEESSLLTGVSLNTINSAQPDKPLEANTSVQTDDMLTLDHLTELLNRIIDNEDLNIEISVTSKSSDNKTKVNAASLLRCKDLNQIKECLTATAATAPIHIANSESSVQAVPLLNDSATQTSLVQASVATQTDLVLASIATQTEFRCRSTPTQTSVPQLDSATTQTETNLRSQLTQTTVTPLSSTSVQYESPFSSSTQHESPSPMTSVSEFMADQPSTIMDETETHAKDMKPSQPNNELRCVSQPLNPGNIPKRINQIKSCPFNLLLKWLRVSTFNRNSATTIRPTDPGMDKALGGMTSGLSTEESIDIKGLIFVNSEGYFSLDHDIMMDMFGYDPRESPFEPCGYAPRYDLPDDLSGIEVPSVRSKDIIFDKNPDESFKEIGRGSYGVVYVGTLSSTNTRIVVKDFINDGVCWELVEHEAQILTMMQDINITPAFHGVITSTIDPQDYSLVQDHYGTGTVEAILEGQYDLPSKSWLKICLHISQALYKIHNSHVLFNDLKADNILVDVKDLGIRFIDFGLATFRHGLQLSGDPENQAPYTFLAPEVRENCESTPHSDIYSLGFLFGIVVQLAEVSELNPLFLACTRTRAKSRPSLVDIIEWLEQKLTS